jgi:hypothetical protein
LVIFLWIEKDEIVRGNGKKYLYKILLYNNKNHMNFIVGAIGANLTLGLVSGIVDATRNVYDISSTIISSTGNGSAEVKKIIKEADLEIRVRSIQYFLCELKMPDNPSHTMIYCMQSIREAVKDISEELEKINYRMQYNDNLWFGSSLRSYKFHNCKSRLAVKLRNLESRYDMLIKILSVDNKICRNPELDMLCPIKQDQIEQYVKIESDDMHKQIEYINKSPC